jgi:IclR family mhp operon transcriptional activator
VHLVYTAFMPSDQPPYPHVRALARGLALLRELNHMGLASPAQLAAATGLDRTTTYRLLATLEEEGYVARNPLNDLYFVLDEVLNLSRGYQHKNAITSVISKELERLVSQIIWPSDFMTFEGGYMVVRESTHRSSAYSIYRGMIGRRLPLLFSAAGRALLVASPPKQRDMFIETARHMGDLTLSDAELQPRLQQLYEDYEQRGYTWSVGALAAPLSAIALPVKLGGGVTGSLNIMFFSSALNIETAAKRYLPTLRECIDRIETKIHEGWE